MLLNKYRIISLTVILLLVGCGSNSTIQETNNEVNARSIIPLVEEEEVTIVEEELKPSNWYIRIVAEDLNRALKTNSAQLGVIEEDDAVIKHTLISRGSTFSGPFLDVVFVDADGVVAGEYKTNYHTYQEGIEDRWRFTVRTDDKSAEILLTWRGLYVLTPYTDDKNRQQYKEYRSLTNPLLNHMKLVDVDTGVEITASIDGKAQIYVLNMNGKNERMFEWVVQGEVVSLPLQSSLLSTPTAKRIQKDVDIVLETTVQKRAESFDLSKPPVFTRVYDEN